MLHPYAANGGVCLVTRAHPMLAIVVDEPVVDTLRRSRWADENLVFSQQLLVKGSKVDLLHRWCHIPP